MSPLVLPVALLIGLSLGALGGGGSILTVPALVYLLGQDARQATTASLVIVGLTSLIALIPHARRGNVRVGQGLVFGILGVAGSFAGAAASGLVPPAVLLTAFAALMLVVAVLMLHRTRRRATDTGHAHATGTAAPMLTWKPFTIAWPRVAKVVLTATAVGLLTGFFGVGGGFALVPALVLALSFSMPVAVGTSLLVIAVNSGTALIARAAGGVHLDWTVIAVFTGVAIVGSLLGGRIAGRVSPQHLTRAFAVLLIAVALYTAARSIPGLF
ncbi:sulfite exporter TauE/SafE family protein [Cumulibacter manganitolerans]|uniref:sulfite exporter TauE/SafE family protein n=1 Tax=Cumulibacter manganitolerans TaxID=1884992 RepID=UPI001885C028|nr:sulfite exporter TauE/SafE family protein [Cumulibacter manganitolerans]